MKNRTGHSRIVALAMLLALVSCTEAPNFSTTVTVALDNPPTNLDTRIGTDASSERIGMLIYSSLVARNEHSDLVPDLAESWEIPDPLTYIFHLRRDVRFHDGRPLTAHDVVFTLDSILQGKVRSPKAGTYRIVKSYEAPDDHTVKFLLKEPFAPFLWNLASGALGIIPRDSPADFARKPIGSGPFVFERFVQDLEVVLRRNPDYYGKKPTIEEVRFRIIPEGITRALEVRKGTVDIALNVLTPDMVDALRNQSHLEVMQADGTIYQYLAFNMQQPPFNDVRVRRAIAHAVDVQAIVRYLWRNQARVATGVIPPNNWCYEPAVHRYEHDPAKARALLAEAGVPNLRFTYRTSQDDVQRLLAAVLQQQMREAGITMDIQSNEFATFFADVVKGNFSAYSLRWIGGNNDPDIFNFVFHSKMAPPNGANRGRYSNPRVDELIELGRREVVDREKRKQYYSEVQRIVADELPYVSLMYLANVCVYNKRIQGMRLYPAGEYEFLSDIRIASEPREP